MRSAVPILLPGLLLTPLPALATQPSDGPAQTIDSEQRIATGRAVLSQGHVDIGPKLAGAGDGEWTLMVHDDSADPSVWRHLDRTVFQVSDAAVLPVPEDPAYSFIGEPGTRVYVLPQVQNPDVVWVGWNTQDPEVMATIDGGVTLILSGVDGPGELFVYLQAGNFGDADLLWDSTKDGKQELWVEMNTHTHANWVFTRPGVYVVLIEVTADLVDGRTVSDTRALRFAVGDTTDTEEAFAAGIPPAATETASAAPAARQNTTIGNGPGAALSVIGGGALLLLVGVVVVAMRGRATRRRALSTRDES